MRIALIAPPWVPVPPPAYGGTEAVVDRLARGFHHAGHEVLLFTTGDASCPVPRGWVVERSDAVVMGDVVTEVRHVLHAYEAAREYDVVHDHTIVGPVWAERFPGLAVVTTNHGPFNEELTDIYRAIEHRVALVAISHHQAATASGVKVSAVIHHGIDTEAFPIGRGDGGYHAFLGRMAPAKGAREAVLVAREAGVPLLMAAKMREPSERAYFDEQVRPLLTDEVRYLGEVSNDEKLQLLGNARSLVNPIRWPEPFGLVMIEAMACGTPVVTFPCGAAPEIVDHGETGYLCRDEGDMARVLHDIDRNDRIDRRACRSSVERRFSTERMVQSHLELFEHLVGGGAPA